ncbi:hypothetical protein HPB48_026692 [Haemaphysalis longicornis]|uniref:Uncharacterized protein n=1 Tax=Haemaphysalis longicornis TaxID=44386 RepID=A0A9J6HC52_HAELO|nr:hypothetical protein HPB48_026692 [Haemaphysalis longicornis]
MRKTGTQGRCLPGPRKQDMHWLRNEESPIGSHLRAEMRTLRRRSPNRGQEMQQTLPDTLHTQERSWEKKKRALERQDRDKDQRTSGEGAGGILKPGKTQMSSLFPALPPAGSGGIQHQKRGRTSRDSTPSHMRNSRSASRKRGDSKARSRSVQAQVQVQVQVQVQSGPGPGPSPNQGTGPTRASRDGRQETHSTNTVSWATAVSQGGTQVQKLHPTAEEK